MIALEISLNGKLVCLAGADDLGVLSAHVTACGKLGSKTVPARPDEPSGEIFYSVGGLTSRLDPRKNVHVNWKSVEPLTVGDVIQVKIVETGKPDRPQTRKNAKANQTVQRTGASRLAQKKNRTSSAAGSRR